MKKPPTARQLAAAEQRIHLAPEHPLRPIALALALAQPDWSIAERAEAAANRCAMVVTIRPATPAAPGRAFAVQPLSTRPGTLQIYIWAGSPHARALAHLRAKDKAKAILRWTQTIDWANVDQDTLAWEERRTQLLQLQSAITGAYFGAVPGEFQVVEYQPCVSTRPAEGKILDKIVGYWHDPDHNVYAENEWQWQAQGEKMAFRISVRHVLNPGEVIAAISATAQFAPKPEE